MGLNGKQILKSQYLRKLLKSSEDTNGKQGLPIFPSNNNPWRKIRPLKALHQ